MKIARKARAKPDPRAPFGGTEAVLFDMDGVLVDTFDAWTSVLEECRERRRLPPLGEEKIRSAWGQGIQADCESFFLGESPDALAREYDEAFLRHLASVRQEPGAAATVLALRRSGLRTALVTNSPVALARRILGSIGLDGEMDALAGGDEVNHGKPHPELVFLALERIGCAPARAVLVGDTLLDLEAGRSAGVRVIGYRMTGGAARVETLEDILSLL